MLKMFSMWNWTCALMIYMAFYLVFFFLFLFSREDGNIDQLETAESEVRNHWDSDDHQENFSAEWESSSRQYSPSKKEKEIYRPSPLHPADLDDDFHLSDDSDHETGFPVHRAVHQSAPTPISSGDFGLYSSSSLFFSLFFHRSLGSPPPLLLTFLMSFFLRIPLPPPPPPFLCFYDHHSYIYSLVILKLGMFVVCLIYESKITVFRVFRLCWTSQMQIPQNFTHEISTCFG